MSAISALEVATLVRRERLRLDRDVGAWVRAALAGERIAEIPLSAAAAVRAGSLDATFPGDPALRERDQARHPARDRGPGDPRL